MFTRAGGADMSLRDVTIAQMGSGARVRWRHVPEAHGGFGWFWKSQLVELCLGRRRLAFAWPFGGCHKCWGGGRWKSQNRKNMYLSPYVEEPLNSKVIKSFVPELRSRKCFSCFEIPMFYVYIYEHSMYVSLIRIIGVVHHLFAQLYNFKYFSLIRIILFTINDLFALS